MVPDETPMGGDAPDPGPGDAFLKDLPLQVLVSHLKDQARVVLTGELDGATAPFLVRTLVDVDATLEGDMILDIGQLSFIDSTGLSVFVSQHKKLEAKGQKLVIYAPSAMARRLFQITGLEQVLAIEPLADPDE